MPAEPRLLKLLLLPLGLWGCGEGPAAPPTEAGHVFTYAPPAGAPAVTTVSVRGTFNAWGPSPLARQSDGTFQGAIELEDGTYEYKFFINGAWPADMCYDPTLGHADREYWIDPDAEGCVPDGFGGRNAIVTIGDGPGLAFRHVAGDPADVSRAAGRLSVRFRARLGQVLSATATTDAGPLAMHRQLVAGLEEVWRAALPEGTTSYAFEIETPGGSESFGPYTVPADPFRAVPWVGDAVGYQIFPERFWNGDPDNDHWTLETDVAGYMEVPWDNGPVLMEVWGGEVLEFHCCHQYFGGDLQGILDRLDHLESLGVTLLYLNPIFTSGSAHGYDTYDHLEVAPNFGDEALLRTLLDEAHTRGIRVLWDFVPNHVGVGHFAFQAAVTDGASSPYWSWFDFHVAAPDIQVGNGNHYDAWWGFGTLPRLETRNAAVFDHLIDVARHWTEFGFDGIRVDVPNEIRNREAFFPALREATRAVNSEVYLVGEIWERDPTWLQGDQFDALMNYVIGRGVIAPFARGEMTGSAAAHEMARVYGDYPEAATAMLFNLIASHDTERLLTGLGGGPLGAAPATAALARQRLASALLYAMPGVPVTFQGDECAFLGAGEGPREENRYPLQWQYCDAAMVDHYRGLAGLRDDLAALRSPVIRAHRGAGPVLSFFRGEPGPDEVLAAFNHAAGTGQSLPLPTGEWTDAVTGEVVSGSVALGALDWRYFRRR